MIMANSCLKKIKHEGKEYASLISEISVENEYILKDFKVPEAKKIIANTIVIHF